jgi:hypothetical protein
MMMMDTIGMNLNYIDDQALIQPMFLIEAHHRGNIQHHSKNMFKTSFFAHKKYILV